MNQQLPILITEVILAVFLIAAFVLVVASTIYDIKQSISRKRLRKIESKFRRSHKPSISILVYAKDSAEAIVNCLDSIRRCRYLNYDVVVINDSSADNIRNMLKSYKQKYSKFPVRLYSKIKRGDKSQALALGYMRSQKGELVLVIDATQSIPKSLIADSAFRLWQDQKFDVLRFNVSDQNKDSITQLYYRFLMLGRIFADKFYTLTSESKTVTNLSGNMYRCFAFEEACKSIEVASKFDSDLVVIDSQINNDKNAVFGQLVNSKNSTVYFGFALVTILLQTYSMYLAASFQNKTIMLVGWLAAAIWLLLITWSADVIKTKEKITLSMCAPFIYFLIYLHLAWCVLYMFLSVFLSILRQITNSFMINAMADVR